MDPLSALSLAGNAIQFVDWGTKLASKSVEIYRSAEGASVSNKDLKTNLVAIVTRLEVPKTGQIQSSGLSKDELALQKLSISCKEVANDLLAVVTAW